MTVLFETVLRMSLTASVVILAVLFFRLLLRKSPKKISYALWSAVGFRLLCPVSFRSVFSLFRIMPEQVTDLVSAAEAELPAAPVLLQSAESAAGSLPLPDVSALPLPMQTFESAFASAPLAPAAEEAVRTAAPAAESVVPVPVDHAALFLKIGAAVWLAVMAVLLLYALVSAVLLKRRLRTATRLSEGVYRSEAVRSPFLLGFLRPKIYVPYGLEPDTLSYVLCHERYHLRRRDDLWKAVGFLALALHWFNPAVWLAFRLMTRDMEMSCDEHVLSENREITRAYSMSLLSFAANRRFPVPSPLAFGECDVKRRIRNVLDWKKPKVWVTVLSALLCVAAVVACAANPKNPSPDALPEADEADTAGQSVEPEAEKTAENPFSEDGLRTSADIRERAGQSIEAASAMIEELTNGTDSIHLQLYQPTEYLLFRQLTALERQYRILTGEGGISNSTITSFYRIYCEDGRGWVDWVFGRTNILRFEIPAFWGDCVVLTRTYEENGSYQLSVLGPSYYVKNGSDEKTDRAWLFTLLLVPAENAGDRTAPEGEGWNRLAAVDTKLNGMFQLWFRPEDKPSAPELAAEDERMRLEIPYILSTLEAPRTNVTLLDTNPDFLSPDEETLARYAAIRQENDAEALRKLDAWLADLTEAYEILRDSDADAVSAEDDPELAALLDWREYGIPEGWFRISPFETGGTVLAERFEPEDVPEDVPEDAPDAGLNTADLPAASEDLLAAFREREEEINQVQDLISMRESELLGLEQEINEMRTETEELRGGTYDPGRLGLLRARISSCRTLVTERKEDLALLKTLWADLRDSLKPFESQLADVMTKEERARVLHRDRLETQYEQPEKEYGLSVLNELEALLSELSAERDAVREEYLALIEQENENRRREEEDALPEDFIVRVWQEIENRRREEEEQARLAQARLEEQRRTEEEMRRAEEEMRRLFEAELEKKHLTEEQAAEAAVSDLPDDGNG